HALKEKVASYIALIGEQASPDSDLQPFISALLEQIDAYYTKFINDLGEAQRLTLDNKVFDPHDFSNQFWFSVQDRWGRGPGYRDDVKSMYTDELDKGDASNFLAETATIWWRERFIEPILDF